MNVAVAHEPEHSRFVLTVDDEPAGRLDYTRDGDTWALIHTEVDPERGGRGLGGTLVEETLRTIDAAGGEVLPLCPFVPRVIQRHPEHLHLVPTDQRSRFGLADQPSSGTPEAG